MRVGRFTVRKAKHAAYYETWMSRDGIEDKLVGVSDSFEDAVNCARTTNAEIQERIEALRTSYDRGEALSDARGNIYAPHDVPPGVMAITKQQRAKGKREREHGGKCKQRILAHPWAETQAGKK